MIDYDDDNLYETYEPQVGEMYAEGTVYKFRHVPSDWQKAWYVAEVVKPNNPEYIYRRPKPSKKEVPMSIPEGWRVLGDDEVIQKGDKRADKDEAPGTYLACIATIGMTVAEAREAYPFILHIIREIEVPTPVTTTPNVPRTAVQRTERDALKAADESGAIKAWYSGKPVQVRSLCTPNAGWDVYTGEHPSFTNEYWEWRPAPAEPPKAVKLDCRPVSEPPEVGASVLAWDGDDWMWIRWQASEARYYTHWAPQPLAPEAE